MEDGKKNAINLIVETYKLYAAFCAIFIAGLLSFASPIELLRDVYLLLISIITLSIASIFCILGLQYFISRSYNEIYDIYSTAAKFIITSVMILIFSGTLTGILFIFNQDKMQLSNPLKSKNCTDTIKTKSYNDKIFKPK